MMRPLLAGLLLALIVQAPAVAGSDSQENPLTVRLENALDVATVQPGEAFKAVLSEEYRHNGKTLPANTLFAGVVERVNVSRAFGRPGYVVLDVQTAQLPNGYVFLLDENRYPSTTDKIIHPKATTVKNKAASTAGFGAVSLATSLPLKLAAGWGSAATVPLSFASKMLFGAGLELSRDDERTGFEKTRWGVFRGTGIPGTFQFIAVSPNPELNAGDEIALELDPRTLEALFEMSTAERPLQSHALKNADMTED